MSLDIQRRSLLAAAAAAAAAGLGPLARAQGAAYPAKPIRVLVPFGPGGVADLTARTVGQKLGELLGQSVIIDNRPGAGGVVAGDTVAKAEPDGYTLLLMSNGTAVSAGLFKSLPFDAQKDFAPISLLGLFDLAIVTPGGSRFRNLGELLAFARANPGKLNLGSINVGSTQNLAAELFKSTAGVNVQVVPFNGTPAIVTALRGGEIDAAVEILSPLLPQVSAKAVHVLAVMGDKRAAALPEVPTVAESGGTLAGFSVASWNALAAPARTPRPVVERLNRELRAALGSPEVKKRLADLNVEARASTPEQLGALLASETRRWSEVIAHAGIARQ
jgi:tripartite-type tricarboxylate transporter receptor subunit TctC